MLASSHRSRLLTAAVALPVLALCVWAGGWPLFLVVLAASLAGLWEFMGFFPGAGGCVRGVSLLLGSLTVWLGWRFGPSAAFAVPLAAFWLEEFSRLYHKPAGEDGPPRWLVAASLLYIPGSLQFLTSFGPGETALVLAVVMATDTGAYYAGHMIGGPKIWPSVSPKKTWAGSIGGLAASVAVCLAASALWGKACWPAFALLGAVMSAASQMGDFMESSLKRAAGIKDSGNLLPGHGGILDRADGLIPAVLVYALARNLTQYL
jgi:phosphatidate cytidylyltransferase